jgi:hypothetical protein
MRHLFNRLKAWLRTPQPAPVIASEARQPMPPTQDALEHLVPFDENLLERSRTQWQFGDWASLAKLDRDTLQHHPDRAKLALLAAAGHQGLGNAAEARQHTRLAIDWGCSKKLVTQILISGVHNTLGRAAAVSGQEQRAHKHFQASIEAGAPSSAVGLLTQARVSHQLEQLGLTGLPLNLQLPSQLTASVEFLGQSSRLEQTLQTMADTIQKQNEELSVQVKQQKVDLISARKFLDSSLKKEVANATRQIEAAAGLQNYFATGELPNVNTERHSWPVSPDFSLYLVELLETNNYDLIIEFGSGISTVIMAKTLAKMTRRHSDKASTTLVSFDHLEQYYKQTLGQLKQADLAEQVQLELAPLKAYTSPNGNTYPYYTCHETLAKLAQKHDLTNTRILVVVDGPPASTGKHARYPAAPLVLTHFKGASIDLLLDDYIRDDEKEIATLWKAELDAERIQHKSSERKLEKDAYLISITAQVAK